MMDGMNLMMGVPMVVWTVVGILLIVLLTAMIVRVTRR